MITLKEYLGGIISSVTDARMMSDVQTVKVAKEYAKHPLLKHFAIPRMRIDDIEFTIPLALDEIVEKTAGEYQPINKKKFNAVAYNEIIKNLKVPRLSRTLSLKLQGEIAKQTQILDEKIGATKDLSHLRAFSREISKFVLKIPEIVEGFRVRVTQEVLQDNLEKTLTHEIKIVPSKSALEDLNVIVETHKLREQKPETLIYIKLKLSEEGLEWDRMEDSSGEIIEKLLPE